MVSEGYYATKSVLVTKSGYGAKTPIIDAVYEILYEGKDARAVFKKLTDQRIKLIYSLDQLHLHYKNMKKFS
jgi:glycerol-3-phosphate dehydrogenase